MQSQVEYQVFFDLRTKYKEYPKRRALVADLMRIFFLQNDCFSDDTSYLYLKDSYSEEDVKLIFEELHLPFFKTFCSSKHSKPISIVQLRDTSKQKEP